MGKPRFNLRLKFEVPEGGVMDVALARAGDSLNSSEGCREKILLITDRTLSTLTKTSDGFLKRNYEVKKDPEIDGYEYVDHSKPVRIEEVSQRDPRFVGCVILYKYQN